MATHADQHADLDVVDLVVVTLRFDAADPASLMAVLSKYVVVTRM